jgi:hypothetical protein
MPEVFTISGAEMGQTQLCPQGWAQTPKGNCGSPVAGCLPEMRFVSGGKVVACRNMGAIQLQNALLALGKTVGDPALSKLTIDGFVGPDTVIAANRAFAVHTTPGEARATWRAGRLTLTQVANEAALMASVVTAEVGRRGGTVPPVPRFKAPAPIIKPVPIEPVAVGPSNAVWAVVGLSAVAAATGIYLTYARPVSEARGRGRTLRPAYA